MSKTTIISIIIVVLVIIGGFYLRKSAMVDTTASTEESLQDIASASSTDGAAATTTGSTPLNQSSEPMYTEATFTTNQGNIVIQFDREHTPNTVENFIKLAESGFYDGTKFHRIIKGFMIQGGDPLTKDDSKQAYWGTGGPGYQFDDEITPENNNVKGTISMANAGPNTNGSQFFINVADNTFLNPKHTVFGKVISGYDLVEKLSNVATDANDRPIDPVVITHISLK